MGASPRESFGVGPNRRDEGRPQWLDTDDGTDEESVDRFQKELRGFPDRHSCVGVSLTREGTGKRGSVAGGDPQSLLGPTTRLRLI